MRRDRVLIISSAVAVIAWIVARRFVQQRAAIQPAVPPYPAFPPAPTSPSVDLARPAAYTPHATLVELEPIGDTTNVTLIPNAEAMIPDEVLLSAPKNIDAAAGALDPIDVSDAVVMDAPSTDEITVSPVAHVPGITATDLVDEPTPRAAAEQAAITPAAVDTTNDSATAAAPDDLVVIEGIGPKISAILIAGGITTFAQLVDADVAQISILLRSAGITTANPSTWPQQAQLARDGQWNALKELQGRIKNGRLES